MSKARELAELGAVYDSGALSNRNMIINGAMAVAQRGTSATTAGNNVQSTCDRWISEHTTAAVNLDSEQVTGPTEKGFQYALKMTAQSTVSLSSAQLLIPFEHRIERTITNPLRFGTSEAKTFTLSFWIKSNKTGTYVVNLSLNNPSGGTADAVSKSYTIDAANTWEYKTVTFPANTSTETSSAFNIRSLSIFWWMAAGSNFTSGTLATSWENETAANRAVGVTSSLTSGDNWQMTGVQLEVGSEATPFEHRSYGQEIELCQRYYNTASGMWMSGQSYGSSGNDGLVQVFRFPTEMRANPSITFSGGSDGGSSAALYSGGVSTSQVNINLRSTSGSDFQVWYSGFTTVADAEI